MGTCNLSSYSHLVIRGGNVLGFWTKIQYYKSFEIKISSFHEVFRLTKSWRYYNNVTRDADIGTSTRNVVIPCKVNMLYSYTNKNLLSFQIFLKKKRVKFVVSVTILLIGGIAIWWMSLSYMDVYVWLSLVALSYWTRSRIPFQLVSFFWRF